MSREEANAGWRTKSRPHVSQAGEVLRTVDAGHVGQPDRGASSVPCDARSCFHSLLAARRQAMDMDERPFTLYGVLSVGGSFRVVGSRGYAQRAPPHDIENTPKGVPLPDHVA